MNITNAQSARSEKALDKLINYEGYGILSRREFCDLMKQEGGRAERVETDHRIDYSRRQYNRMNGAEQAQYEKRLSRKKTEYRMHLPGDKSGYIVITKAEYDYFNQ